MKQEKLSILFPRQDEVTYQLIPEETWHDLGMDALAEKVARQPQEVPLIQRVMMSLTDDPAVAAFRCSVFADILRDAVCSVTAASECRFNYPIQPKRSRFFAQMAKSGNIPATVAEEDDFRQNFSFALFAGQFLIDDLDQTLFKQSGAKRRKNFPLHPGYARWNIGIFE